ncbi:MBL fold metallo-hydrolase [Riemerella anatipestifer]|uniref:Putative metallo-hydrolase n=1 Tax=Riemerella anatipestifer TaxID=34085 RepID=A0A1S7DSF4_RIEAN|nr:MBL fold metallo-hydrolase [Riemerella anatipestifer]AQY21998.1 putative metallo-hydrolase [Riemerella anatipestifer]MCO4303958.1 MBL fold metallo-hydrolase [Riemerella anatipestifer]MCO7352548.1 MBL fold metallo-hydrolase [Riemerella anatipestifer]MCQ4039274.1 MBL fold metallo-hydrolase [Riemerella anatipestifer]MCT6760928.1 MBL fold metallo-hydrolase [Riemerella anatipestifer]
MLSIKTFTFNPFSENTYLVYNEAKQAFIIDPGNFTANETLALSEFITSQNLTVKNILLTHAHIDHIAGLQWAFDTYQVPVLMHQLDQELLDRAPLTARQYGFNMLPFVGQTTFIDEGETLQLGTDTLHLLHTPGHSPGSISFYHKEQNWVISGDVLFQGSIGRTDLYKGNYEQLIESIKTKLLTLPPNTQVYSGHGASTNIGFEQQYNPFLK